MHQKLQLLLNHKFYSAQSKDIKNWIQQVLCERCNNLKLAISKYSDDYNFYTILSPSDVGIHNAITQVAACTY